MSAVKLDRVTKSFGQTIAAHDVSFGVAPGEFLTLLGPSGCGKTTLLRIVAGFLRPTSGLVSLAGRPVNHLPAHLRRVGLVFQSYALFPHMTVRNNVAFGLKMHGARPAEIARRVAEILDLVQLADRADHFPGQLSGGQQQRVALARALVTQPTILLLDEPFSALDRKIGELLRTELKRIQRRLSISTILVTHAQDEALMLSDRVAVMNKGRIEQIGAPEDLYRQPASRFVAEFLGRSNIVAVRRDGRDLRIVGAGRKGSPGGVAMIRPELVRPIESANPAGAHQYCGSVEEIQYLGHFRIARIQLDVGAAIEAIALSGDGPGPSVGSKIVVEIARAAFHVIEEAE